MNSLASLGPWNENIQAFSQIGHKISFPLLHFAVALRHVFSTSPVVVIK